MGKHERLENYLWVVSVGVGDDQKWAIHGSSERRRSAQRFRTPARPGGAVLRPEWWREAGAPVGGAQGFAEAARSVQQHAGGSMARERARKRRKRDGTRRARASVSRWESILIPRLEGEGPEGRNDVQPEFR